MDGQVIFVHFNYPDVLTVDRTGNVVVVDWGNQCTNHVIHSVTKEGVVVITVTDDRQENGYKNDEEHFGDGQGVNTLLLKTVQWENPFNFLNVKKIERSKN